MTDRFFSRGFYSSKRPKGNDASDLSGSVGIELIHNFSNTVVVPVISQSFVHNLSVGVEIFDNWNCNTVVPVSNQASVESNITPRLNVTSTNVIEGGIGDVDNNVEDDYDSGDD